MDTNVPCCCADYRAGASLKQTKWIESRLRDNDVESRCGERTEGTMQGDEMIWAEVILMVVGGLFAGAAFATAVALLIWKLMLEEDD